MSLVLHNLDKVPGFKGHLPTSTGSASITDHDITYEGNLRRLVQTIDYDSSNGAVSVSLSQTHQQFISLFAFLISTCLLKNH